MTCNGFIFVNKKKKKSQFRVDLKYKKISLKINKFNGNVREIVRTKNNKQVQHVTIHVANNSSVIEGIFFHNFSLQTL